MTLHVSFVILGETAREYGDCADRTPNGGELTASIRPLACSLVF